MVLSPPLVVEPPALHCAKLNRQHTECWNGLNIFDVDMYLRGFIYFFFLVISETANGGKIYMGGGVELF